MLNVTFAYVYRDAGNNKIYHDVIFNNPEALDIQEITPMLENALIQGEYFLPHLVNLPRLQFETENEELDHEWHEFISLEMTSERVTDSEQRTLAQLLTELNVVTMMSPFYGPKGD